MVIKPLPKRLVFKKVFYSYCINYMTIKKEKKSRHSCLNVEIFFVYFKLLKAITDTKAENGFELNARAWVWISISIYD